MREFPFEHRPRNTHIFPRAEREHYVDPLWLSARLFQVEDFGPRGSPLLDPACGWGRIVRSALDAGYRITAADVFDSRKIIELDLADVPFSVEDFLTSTGMVGSIVTNPPYDKLQLFCERAVERAQYKAALLCPLPRLPAARWLQALPLQTVYLASPRPSLPSAAYLETGRKPGGGRPEYCWLVFARNHVGPAALKWLIRDRSAACESLA
jgi:hypothetical protein